MPNASKKTLSTIAAAPPADAPQEDHRVRTGVLRREQTRRRLLVAAMGVFAEKGVVAPLIDDFIAAADVARGTFYNYFSTTQELLDAVTSELSDSVMFEIDKVVVTIHDPLERLATACLVYMHTAVNLPNWGAFVMRTSSPGEAMGKLVDAYMPRDLELARQAGELSYPTVRAARDLMVSAVNQAINSVLSEQAPPEHLSHLLSLSLRGLGVRAAKAQRLSKLPLPQLALPEFLPSGTKAGR